MSFEQLLVRWCGFDDVALVDDLRLTWLAPWAEGAWRFFGCVALAGLAFAFYTRGERRRRSRSRPVLAVSRALLLSLVFLILAEPVLTVSLVRTPRPYFWLLFDGSDSMAIRDRLSPAETRSYEEAAGIAFAAAGAHASSEGRSDAAAGGASGDRARVDWLRALVAKGDGGFLRALEAKCRLRAFVFDREDGVRALDVLDEDGRLDASRLAAALSTSGEVTAIGAALADLRRRHESGNLAGVLVASDFDQNSGPSAVEEARRLGAPVHTLGVGPIAALDVGVDIQAPLVMKKAERSTVVVTIRQSGLDGESVRLRASAIPLDGEDRTEVPIDDREVELAGATTTIDVRYTPARAGRESIVASVDPIAGEVVAQNNRAARDVSVRDDYLRLFFVEYEPTWEWRFIKEVFYRDALVGARGFRTFLRSADPKVRQAGGLFAATLTPPRSEFFANDVIVVGDLPQSALTPRFCELTREFVSTFGGGLVIVSGPRFGPGELAETALADMLPVVVDPRLELRDDREFRLELTPDAALVDFVRLGDDADENARAWANLGPLPWYRPVARLHPLATALAVHPTDTCVDEETPQPLIAIRRFGKGEVVYLGFNETWRLRRRYGERYFRQFWGQMIHRLGLSHALGSEKRFVVRTDRQRYRADDDVVVTVEAYDADFEPLGAEDPEDGDPLARGLEAELVAPDTPSEATAALWSTRLTRLRPGVFEGRLRVVSGGEHRVRVQDPETGEWSEVRFEVAGLSPERRSAVRNAAIEREIAVASGGVVHDLRSIARLPDVVEVRSRRETSVEVISLWNTWPVFWIVVTLMLGEWLLRKLSSLP